MVIASHRGISRLILLIVLLAVVIGFAATPASAIGVGCGGGCQDRPSDTETIGVGP
jgi:hypothetical protein